MQSACIKRSNVAVASFNGTTVNLHIGQATHFLIFGPGRNGCIHLLDTRTAPEKGGGETRWEALADVLNDCLAILTSGAGSKPIKILEDRGIDVFITEGSIKRPVEIILDRKMQEYG